MTSVTSLPANYAKPLTVTTVYGDPAFGATRTEVTKSSYDDQGQQTAFTNAAGTTTTTTYDPRYGLPLTQTVTGTDGVTSIATNTLTADGKSVYQATTAAATAGAKGAVTATARTVATYSYNSFGQVTGEMLAWAPGAKPAGDSDGPDQVADTQQHQRRHRRAHPDRGDHHRGRHPAGGVHRHGDRPGHRAGAVADQPGQPDHQLYLRRAGPAADGDRARRADHQDRVQQSPTVKPR